MKFIKTAIPGVLVIEPRVIRDGRGFFIEEYHKRLFARHGIRTDFVQDNHSGSRRGVLRGLHYQAGPAAQAKLVRVIRGSAFDVVVDIRKNSKTHGKAVCSVLSAENRRMVYIPPGFAHGFLALKDGTELLYKVSKFYSAKSERGILWNDPALGIPWPKLDIPYILSEKDKRHPVLMRR